MYKIYLMTVVDLIMKLSSLPPEMEIVVDKTREGDEVFRLMPVDDAVIIGTDIGDRYVLLYQEGTLGPHEELGEDEDDE